jgi:hypothetical protein
MDKKKKTGKKDETAPCCTDDTGLCCSDKNSCSIDCGPKAKKDKPGCGCGNC